MKVDLTYGQCLTLLKLVNHRLNTERRARERPTRVTTRAVVIARGGDDVSAKYIERLTILKGLLIKASGQDPAVIQAQLNAKPGHDIEQ